MAFFKLTLPPVFKSALPVGAKQAASLESLGITVGRLGVLGPWKPTLVAGPPASAVEPADIRCGLL